MFRLQRIQSNSTEEDYSVFVFTSTKQYPNLKQTETSTQESINTTGDAIKNEVLKEDKRLGN